MAITRAEKEAAVDQLKDELGRIKLAVLTDYRGLTVPEIQQLRGLLNAEGVRYRVTKNTLLKIAVKKHPALANIDMSIFNGPMALALGFEDAVAAARIVYQYAKEHEALEIMGAISAEGELLSSAQVKALALLPTREQLLASLVGQIAAPASSLVGVMAAQLRSLMYVLGAAVNKETT